MQFITKMDLKLLTISSSQMILISSRATGRWSFPLLLRIVIRWALNLPTETWSTIKTLSKLISHMITPMPWEQCFDDRDTMTCRARELRQEINGETHANVWNVCIHLSPAEVKPALLLIGLMHPDNLVNKQNFSACKLQFWLSPAVHRKWLDLRSRHNNTGAQQHCSNIKQYDI